MNNQNKNRNTTAVVMMGDNDQHNTKQPPREHPSTAHLIQEKTIEVVYLASQRHYDQLARLEAVRESCAEFGWTLGTA